MSELLEMFEEQKSYSYITQEMIILEQQVQKALNWQKRVHSIRDQEAHQRVIEQIYVDGKNIPVNFQGLMEEIRKRKKQAEDINCRIQDAIIVKKTRMKTKKGTEDNSQPDQVDKE
jgi:hypothetical protein